MSRYDTQPWKDLVNIQNKMQHIDILTITGFMDDAQLKAHYERYKALIDNK